MSLPYLDRRMQHIGPDQISRWDMKTSNNVLEIKKENNGCWIMAFRYNIEMRQTYFTFRVGDNKDMAEIGVRNKKVECRAERQTVMRNNDLFLDNPYADGQTKQNINPIDGSNWEGKPTAWDDPTRGETKPGKGDGYRETQSVRLALCAQARSESHTNSPQYTPESYHQQPQPRYPAPTYPPTQPASSYGGMNPNFRGNPQNYIHKFRPNYRGGRTGSADGCPGGGMGGGPVGGAGYRGRSGGWETARQGAESTSENRQGVENGNGAGKGAPQKK